MITLPNGLRAEIISSTGKLTRVRYENGKEGYIPNDFMPVESETELRVVQLSAAERLDEVCAEIQRVKQNGNDRAVLVFLEQLRGEIYEQYIKEVKAKWGIPDED